MGAAKMLLATVALTSLAVASARAEPPARPLAVVVAKTAKLTSLSRAEVRRAFGGETLKIGGVRLVPFNFAASSRERIAFDRVILGMAPDAVGRFWVDRKIRGQSPAPRSLAQGSHVVKVVSKFPGALGYVPADQVTPELTILAIDGLLPGDHGYPLQVPE